jgi:hypothetical protein
VHTSVADGPAMGPNDKPKDCQASACMGGMLVQVPDDTDLPDDGNLCTKDICTNGVPSNPFESSTKDCGASLVCDGAGSCVGCVNSNMCADPGTCKSGACDMGQCKSVNDPAGQNCQGNKVCDGGGNCVECLNNGDCTGTKICVNSVCITSCNDSMKDGTETDVDCGGFCQANCANGKMCNGNNDCQSDICAGGTCIAAVTCFDNVKNGTESDVDCGGTCALKCAIGDSCKSGADCATATCTGMLCVAAPPTCTDMIQNGTESDVDCGGSCATKCALTKKCVTGADCLSATCTGLVCVAAAPTCSDMIQNGTESDVDCGGSCATKCVTGKKCVSGTDCVSTICTAMVCN